MKKESVHLQNFPDVSFIKEDEELERDMDLVRDICSTTLAIRDQKNLRVRLPLKTLTIIGKNSQNILPFVDIIADEVNVKDVKIDNNIDEIAQFKLQINFKKIGSKYGNKMKEILQAVKEDKWQKLPGNKIKIADLTLEKDEFELKTIPKTEQNEDLAIAPLSSSEYLIALDTKITQDLEYEGIARDIVRIVQQNRKEADLDISDRINLTIGTNDTKIAEIIDQFNNYIAKQVLADNVITASQDVLDEFNFRNQIEDKTITIGIKIID